MEFSIPMILVLVISMAIWVTTARELDCGPVHNLKIIETDLTLEAFWDPPIGNDCNSDLFYIEFTIDGNHILSTFVGLTSIILKKESCKQHQIGVQSRGIRGEPLHWTHETIITRNTGSAEIENLQFTNKSNLSWTAPNNSELCDIRYIVKIIPDSFDSTTRIVSTTKTEISLIPCENHSISVTTYFPQSMNWTGEPVKIFESGPIKKLSPNHVSTWPNKTGAFVSWIEQEEDNACTINEIEFIYTLVKINDSEQHFVQSFKISDDSWYQLDNMEENKEYLYWARWKLPDGKFGDNSSTINVLLKQLTSPIINRIDATTIDNESSLQIQWYQLYPIHFVTEHIITVIGMGCDCKDEKELLEWKFKNAPNEKTVIATPIFVNHTYNIEVQTIFGHLNAYTTNSTIFKNINHTKRPGRIIEISGTKNIDWTIRFGLKKI